MTTNQDLEPLLAQPREDLAVEYKSWLHLSENEHRATLAKAAIALANHGGGYIVIGLTENGEALNSVERPDDIPEVTQDAANGAIQRFCDPEFHVGLFLVESPISGVVHPVIAVPSDLSVPVMSKRDCQNVLQKHRCYVRKPGPRSEPPTTSAEWRALLDRCVRANRDDLLDSFRVIMARGTSDFETDPDDRTLLIEFCENAKSRWQELSETTPEGSAARFEHGYFEMGFSLNGADELASLSALQDALAQARRIKLTGWTPFLEMTVPEWQPYPHENFVEAWIGRIPEGRDEDREYGHSDFWRASPQGLLYTIRGHQEDDIERYPVGTAMDATIPVWRVGEALLFASRFAASFEGVEQIGIFCRYTGLQGRSLVSVSGNRLFFDDRTSQSDEITLEGTATIDQINDNLVEVLMRLLTPLYERFDFFRLSEELVRRELEHLRNRRF